MILPVRINESDLNDCASKAYPCFPDPKTTFTIICSLCSWCVILPSAGWSLFISYVHRSAMHQTDVIVPIVRP